MDVFRIPDFLAGETCDAILHEMRNAPAASAHVYGIAGGGKVDPRIRKVEQLAVSNETAAADRDRDRISLG